MSKNTEAARILHIVGRALYPGREDWKSQLAFDLDVAPSSIRQWEKGHLNFGVKHGVVGDMITLLDCRARNAALARLYLIKLRNNI